MFLLDTCTLLWLASDQSHLSAEARRTISDGAGSLFVSAISAFEIGVKHEKGQYVLSAPPTLWFPRALKLHGLRHIAVTPRIALRSTTLPMLHRDPMDRILIATAQAEAEEAGALPGFGKSLMGTPELGKAVTRGLGN